MGNALSLFKIMLVVMMFYSVAITLLNYSLAGQTGALDQLGVFGQGSISLDAVSTKVQSSMSSQLGIPLIAQFGALMLFSGNILVDLLLNFVFAVPQMIMILVNSLCMLFSINAYINATIQALFYTAYLALFMISIIQLLVNLRSGGSRLPV